MPHSPPPPEQPKEGPNGLAVYTLDPDILASIYALQDRSLADYWHLILARKRLLLIVTVLAIALSALLTLLLSPQYETRLFGISPHASQIPGIAVPGQEIESADPEALFGRFLVHLGSRSLRRRYFDDNDLIGVLAPGVSDPSEVQKVFEERFSQRLEVDPDKGAVLIRLVAHDAGLAAAWLNGFVELADRTAAREFLDSIRSRVELEIRVAEAELAASREVARRRREDRIEVLNEGLGMARRLGISTPMRTFGPASIYAPDTPLYVRGTRALEQEIRALQQRESDDPHIPELRGLEERLTRLRSLNLDRVDVRSVTIDEAATPFGSRLGRPVLRAVLAAVGALVAAVLWILAQSALQEPPKGSLGNPQDPGRASPSGIA